MKYILIIAGLFLSGTLQAQFTGTDSLRNYNNRYITNNPATAFTNLRLHTLLRGMIDYIDTARAGTGGGGAVGVDTLWALNDSTVRYRKNGVFRNFILPGVYDTRRKVDTAYALNDSTLQIKINGTNRNIILPGRYWDLQGVLNNGSTLIENETVTLSDSLTFTSGMVIIDTLNLPSLQTTADTTSNKPVVVDASGNVHKMTSWPASPTGDYITELTGDVTASGPGSAAATIATNAVTNTKLAQAPAFSVKGNAFNAVDDVGDILALNDHSVLRRNGTSINFGAINLGSTNAVGSSILPVANGGTGTASPALVAGTNVSITGTWPNQTINSTGGGQTLYSDLGPLSETKLYIPGKGVASSSNVTGYSHTSVDSARYQFTTGGTGNEKGGWISTAASGDSIRITALFGVIFGNSIMEGHGEPPVLHGRLHPNGSNTFQWDYPDSAGQISYHLRALTNMRWYNHGIGGQTSVQGRARFYRDVLGQVSANASDGRGTQTLTRKPFIVIIEFGINDIFNGVPLQTIKDNLEWMASQCQQNGQRCVILNCPGDASANQSQLQMIADLNLWLRSGVMDQYGACVVDFNRWWNNPAYGYDNIHPTTLIYDGIHPTKVGYDSLANFIFREAKLPVLTKAVFITEVSPTSPARVAYPTSITINSIPYTLTSNVDTIDITSYVPDSVWVKVNTSANLTGDTAAVGHVEWYVDNNPNDTTYYTKRTLYSGSQKANMNTSQLTMYAPTLENGYNMIDGYLGDMTTSAFRFTTYAATARMFLAGTTLYNSATLNITNSATALGTNGNLYATGTNHLFGQFQLLVNGNASTFGNGLSVNNTASAMRLQHNQMSGRDQFRFDAWNGGVTSLGSSATNLLAITNTGFGNSGGINQVANSISITPTINHSTSANTGIIIRGLYYNPTLTALGNARHNGFVQTTGNNYFNVTSDSTCYGCAESDNILAKFRVNGSTRIDLGSDATGDIFYRNSSGLFTRLGIGSDGDVLTLASGLPSWAAPSSGSSGIDDVLATDNEITTNRAIEIGLNNFNFTTSGADIFSFGPSETYSYKDHFFGAKVYFETMGGVLHTNVPSATTQPTYKPLIDTATGQVLKVIEPKTYTALLSQSGSSAPTSTVLGTNTIGTIVWTRNSAGNYTGTLSAAFTSNKTWLIVQQGDQNGSFINSILSWTDANSLLLTTYDNVGNPSDGFSNMSIEIRVYP